MQHYTDFGAEARKIMLQKGITMTVVAKELGITVSYLSDILKGNRAGVRHKDRIAEILGMPKKVG